MLCAASLKSGIIIIEVLLHYFIKKMLTFYNYIFTPVIIII